MRRKNFLHTDVNLLTKSSGHSIGPLEKIVPNNKQVSVETNHVLVKLRPLTR